MLSNRQISLLGLWAFQITNYEFAQLQSPRDISQVDLVLQFQTIYRNWCCHKSTCTYKHILYCINGCYIIEHTNDSIFSCYGIFWQFDCKSWQLLTTYCNFHANNQAVSSSVCISFTLPMCLSRRSVIIGSVYFPSYLFWAPNVGSKVSYETYMHF